MKTIIKNLETQLEKLRNKVEQREDYVLNRSDKWQESEKCEVYEDKTLEIDGLADELENLIDELKELL